MSDDVQGYRAEVTIVLALVLEARSQAEAEERALRMTRSRQIIRRSDIRQLCVTPMTVSQKLTTDNVRIWQETEALQLGTSNQRQRWNSGCLPEGDLLLIARDEIFRPFSLCARRTRKGAAAIRHPTDARGAWTCAESAVGGTIPIRWANLPDPKLTETQWGSLQRILTAGDEVRRHAWMRLSPPTSVRVEIREHRGECLSCHGQSSENAALVEIDWAGRVLSREYVL